jgi:hypothetical protein
MTGSKMITGYLEEGRIVTLDEELPIKTAKLTMKLESVEPLTRELDASDIQATSRRPLMEVMEEIWQAQRERGHVPLTKEEVDAYIQGERDSWGD